MRQDIIESGFTINEEKSNWIPRHEVCFVESVLNVGTGTIHLPSQRIKRQHNSKIVVEQSKVL